MQKTTKLNLNKPELTDYVLISDLNENMDILDATVGELKEGSAEIPELQTADKTLAGAINEVDEKVANVNTDVETNTSSIQKLDGNFTTHLADNAKHTSTTEKNTWNGKYSKPVNGIPKTDLDTAVQNSLGKADTSIQESMKNVPNGVLGLDENGNVPISQMPNQQIASGSWVNNTAARTVYLGFRPKFIFARGEQTGYPQNVRGPFVWDTKGMDRTALQYSGGSSSSTAVILNAVTITDTGFTINSGAGGSGDTWYWWATD